MKIEVFTVLIHKLRRKGIRGTLLVIYYRLTLFVARNFPSNIFPLWGIKQPDDCATRNTWEHLDKNIPFRPGLQFSVEERNHIIDLIPVSLRRSTIESADKIMSFSFNFKGEPHQFSKSIDWFLEPSGNKGWRWELNRHLFLLTLAKAYLYSNESKYLQRIEHIIMDWCKQNPPSLQGPNWNEPFEVAARLSNWIWLYYLLNDSDENIRSLTFTLLNGIQKHGDYLFRFMEIHIPNNHLLLEARALYHAYMVLEYTTAPKKWLNKSSKYLFNEFERQVRSDGGHSEQCITYHRIINSELWETYLLMSRESKLVILPQFRSALLAMTEFTRGMMRPDGSFPLTSDSTAVDTYYRFNPFMIAAVLMDRPDLKSAAMLLGEDDLTFFALGFELASKYTHMEPQALREGSEAFTESGYYVMKDNSMGLHALIDNGPFCDELIPAHGHDDILSIDLTLKGSPLLMDGGNDGLPLEAPEAWRWREYFRGASSHNVLVVSHSNRSFLSGYNDVVKVAKPLASEWLVGKSVDYFSGAHDGYLQSLGIIHQRELILVKGHFLCILDRLIGKSNHQFEILYHLAPDKKAVVRDQAVEVSNDKGSFAQIAFFGIPGEITIARGNMNPVQGWISLESGCRMKTDSISFNARAELPLCIGTIIQIHKRQMFKIRSVKFLSSTPHYQTFDFVLSGPDADYEFSTASQFSGDVPQNSRCRGSFVLRRKTGNDSYETLFSKD